MAGGADSFLPPKFTNVVDKDPRIVKNDEDDMEFASRPSAMPKVGKNEMTLKHTGGSGGEK